MESCNSASVHPLIEGNLEIIENNQKCAKNPYKSAVAYKIRYFELDNRENIGRNLVNNQKYWQKIQRKTQEISLKALEISHNIIT